MENLDIDDYWCSVKNIHKIDEIFLIRVLDRNIHLLTLHLQV